MVPLMSVLVFFTVFCLFLLLCMLYIGSLFIKHTNKAVYKDNLTELANNKSFKQHVELLEKNGVLDKYAYVTVDIDRFKMVNAVAGTDVGTALLKHIADILIGSIDLVNDNEYVARINADVFSLLMLRKSTKGSLDERLHKITHGIKLFSCPGVVVTPSIGVYKIYDNDVEYIEVTTNADFAKKSIKGNTVVEIAYFNERETNDIVEGEVLLSELPSAFKNEDIKVFYQMKYDFKKGEAVGAEALVRWQHPKKGLLFPNAFLPKIEKTNYILDLDMYVFEKVCKDIERWRKAYNSESLVISINMTGGSLLREGLLEKLNEITKQYNVPHHMLELEILESFFFNPEVTNRLIDVIKGIRDAGYSIAMDDFGAGYSSFNLLQSLDIDILKIDKSLLDNVLLNDKASIVLESIVDMAQKMGICVVAEGVEYEEQAEYLKGIGCDIGQGYLYSKPISAWEFEDKIVSKNQ